MTEFIEIDALLAAIDHEKQPVKIGEYTTRLQPVTVLQSVRLVGRFPKLIDLFEDRVDDKGVKLPQEQQPTLLSVLLDCGSDAVAALVACSAGREGDVALERAFASAPDSLTLKLFPAAVKITLGEGSLQDFFTRVRMALMEAGLLRVDQQKPDAAPAKKAA